MLAVISQQRNRTIRVRPAWRALIVGAALFGAKAASAAPTLTCRVERAGERSLVIGRLEDLFDRELLRLVELGLPGRLHAEAKLYRPRGLWFDARIADTKQVFIVTWSKERSEFRLDGRRLPSAQRFELPVIALRPEEPGGSYVELTVRLEIITARSLGQVASWLVTGQTAAAGQEDDAESKGKTAGAANPTPLPRALVDYLAADLIRTTESKCPVGK